MRNRKNRNRHRRRRRNRGYRRRRNPAVVRAANRSYRRANRRYRRRRNPSVGDFKRVGKTAFFAIGGGVGTKLLPELILKDKNTGWVGWASNAVSAFLLSALAGRFISKEAGEGVFVGGAVMTVGRIIDDLTGYQPVTFGGLPAFPSLSGEFVPQAFPVPYSSLPHVTPAGMLPAGVPSGMAGPWAGSPWAN